MKPFFFFIAFCMHTIKRVLSGYFATFITMFLSALKFRSVIITICWPLTVTRSAQTRDTNKLTVKLLINLYRSPVEKQKTDPVVGRVAVIARDSFGFRTFSAPCGHGGVGIKFTPSPPSHYHTRNNINSDFSAEDFLRVGKFSITHVGIKWRELLK